MVIDRICPKTYALDSLKLVQSLHQKSLSAGICMVGTQRVKSGGPGTVCVAKGGHSETTWDLNKNTSNHGSHCQCCQVFVPVIFFRYFVF